MRPGAGYDQYNGYKEPVRGYATTTNFNPTPGYTVGPGYGQANDYSQSYGPVYNSTASTGLAQTNLCSYHRQELTCFCAGCNAFLCETCKLQCKKDHQHTNFHALEDTIKREAEQSLLELSTEMNKRQNLDKQIAELNWDAGVWTIRAVNDLKTLESRIRDIGMQKQNENTVAMQRMMERRAEMTQNLRKEISGIIAYKGMADGLLKKIQFAPGNLNGAKLKALKDELDGLKQAKTGLNPGLFNSASAVYQQYTKMMTGEWKADVLLELYFLEGAGKSQLGQIIAASQALAEKITALDQKRHELDLIRDQEKALSASLTEAASQLKSMSFSFDEKLIKPAPMRPEPYNPYPEPLRMNDPVPLPAFPRKMETGTFFRQEESAAVSAQRPSTAAMHPTSSITRAMKTIQCCKKTVDQVGYLGDLDRFNRNLLSVKQAEVSQEQLYCPYCNRVIYKKDLLDWEFPIDQVERVISYYPTKKEEVFINVICIKCGKPITRPQEKITPCEHTFHKRCLLEYIESGNNDQCQKCGRHLNDAYRELAKERANKPKTCCICDSSTPTPYQNLSCGHYFCKECYMKCCASSLYFDHSDKGCKVQCQQCNSKVLLLKVQLECGCVFELESLKVKLLSGYGGVTGGTHAAVAFYCPNCRTKPIYKEESMLIFGFNAYNDILKNGRNSVVFDQILSQPNGPAQTHALTPNNGQSVVYQKDVCKNCNMRAEGVSKYKCADAFLCRTCIKAYKRFRYVLVYLTKLTARDNISS